MATYFGVIGNRDYIKYHDERRPFWEFLDHQPDGWLTSLAYERADLPQGKRMIFDCGAWSYKDAETPRLGKQLVTPEWVYGRYLERAQPGDFLIAPDHMLIPGVDLDARRTFNAASAAEFLHIVDAGVYTPMATVHGDNLDERIATAQRYADMGYPALALGGMAARASQKTLVLEIAREVRLAVPSVWLHVLGLSSPAYALAWQEYGINSFDGSSHFKQAFTAGAFFERDGMNLRKHQAARPGEPITAPLCNCRACTLLREDGIDTRTYGSNENNMGRAAHNLNMLMQAQKAAVRGEIILVSCVGEKLSNAAPAADLYQSDWFIKARRYAEAHAQRWYILSALHGLVAPETIIEPYNVTLNDLPAAERRTWAERVAAQIQQSITPGALTILAGKHYREHLTEMLPAYTFDVPMQGLGIGQQLAWLDAHTPADDTQLTLF